MQVDARGKLPGVLFLAGAGTVMVSTFLPWRQSTSAIISGPGGKFLAGFALVIAGFVGLAMLVRRSNILAAVVGILVALFVVFNIAIDYGIAENIFTSRDPEIVEFVARGQMHLMADTGPGSYVSVVGAIAMLIGSVIGLAKRLRRPLRIPSQVCPLPSAMMSMTLHRLLGGSEGRRK
jgi:hypothetical protein